MPPGPGSPACPNNVGPFSHIESLSRPRDCESLFAEHVNPEYEKTLGRSEELII